MALSSAFHQSFSKDLGPIGLKVFQKSEEVILSNTFDEANITLIPKSGKDNTKGTLQAKYPK